MPFIQRPRLPLGDSWHGDLNFLWRAENRRAYVMDNHRGALWCWLEELALEDPCALLHIDFHWDARPLADEQIEQIRGIDRRPLEDYLSLRTTNELNSSVPTIAWDNYIWPLRALRPKLGRAVLLAHQDAPSDPPPGSPLFPCSEPRASILMEGAEYHTEPHGFLGSFSGVAQPGEVLLVNLDLDFFFVSWGGGKVTQAYSDEFVEDLVRAIDSVAPDAIWTIAWSPECCGSWANAAKVFRVVNRTLDLRFPFARLGLKNALAIQSGGC